MEGFLNSCRASRVTVEDPASESRGSSNFVLITTFTFRVVLFFWFCLETYYTKCTHEEAVPQDFGLSIKKQQQRAFFFLALVILIWYG